MNQKPFWRGLLRTVLTLALSLFLLSLLVFVIAHYAPGDPLRAYFGDRVEKMSVDERAWAEAKLGLDRPVLTQYGIWLQNALHGDFGISYKYKMDVLEVIRTRLPYTLRLGGVGFVPLFVLSLGVGVLCARHEDSLLDRILCRVGTVMSCVPEFWLSLVLILLFAVELRWLPSSGAYSVGGDGGFADRAVHLILPVTVVVLGHLWYYAYLVRSRLIEELHADYILLAKGKGLPKRTVLLRHALRNVLPSYLSIMAITVWGKRGNDYYLRYCLNRHLDFPGTLAAIRTVRGLYPNARAVLIEDKANGSAVIQVLQSEMFCIPIQPLGGKVARVNAVSPAIESGHVYVPEGEPWAEEFLGQWTSFPAGAHDDMVDSGSQALRYLLRADGGERKETENEGCGLEDVFEVYE